MDTATTHEHDPSAERAVAHEAGPCYTGAEDRAKARELPRGARPVNRAKNKNKKNVILLHDNLAKQGARGHSKRGAGSYCIAILLFVLVSAFSINISSQKLPLDCLRQQTRSTTQTEDDAWQRTAGEAQDTDCLITKEICPTAWATFTGRPMSTNTCHRNRPTSLSAARKCCQPPSRVRATTHARSGLVVENGRPDSTPMGLGTPTSLRPKSRARPRTWRITTMRRGREGTDCVNIDHTEEIFLLFFEGGEGRGWRREDAHVPFLKDVAGATPSCTHPEPPIFRPAVNVHAECKARSHHPLRDVALGEDDARHRHEAGQHPAQAHGPVVHGRRRVEEREVRGVGSGVGGHCRVRRQPRRLGVTQRRANSMEGMLHVWGIMRGEGLLSSLQWDSHALAGTETLKGVDERARRNVGCMVLERGPK